MMPSVRPAPLGTRQRERVHFVIDQEQRLKVEAFAAENEHETIGAAIRVLIRRGLKATASSAQAA